MKPRRLRKLDFSDNLRFVKRFVSQTLSPVLLEQLRELTLTSSFSVRHGDLVLLSSGWYVTHTGLIRLATRRRCRGIEAHPIPEFSDAKNGRYVFKATVFKSRTCQGFVGYGDADPSNVSLLVHGAEMRVAETRAVNRALRKAYGIGTCSIEEIGSVAEPVQASRDSKKLPTTGERKRWRSYGPRSPLPSHPPASTRSQPGQSLRDRLLRCQNPARCYSGIGREFRRSPSRLG
jgi:hypothetical protein